jgi:pyridoxal phosphate enzyme (YggS family)
MDSIQQNLKILREKIAETCARCGRKADEITIIAVTKTHPAEVVRQAVAVGLTEIGENRIQEAEIKLAELGQIARYHLIGHLQSNKVKKAVQLFDVIQSVDSLNIALEISRRAGEIGKTLECMIEVNSSGEPQKFGVLPKETIDLAKNVISLPNIILTGLMTVGPLTDDESSIRDSFRMCHELFINSRDKFGMQMKMLSMGMSGDFEIGIEEGATMIRIGSILFGER